MGFWMLDGDHPPKVLLSVAMIYLYIDYMYIYLNICIYI